MYQRILIAALALALLLPGVASASSITLQVYQVCDNAGANCASKGLPGDDFFAAATNKIWAQAGINIFYNFVGQIHSTLFSNIDDSVVGRRFQDLAAGYHYQSTTIVDMFLVHTVAGAYGEGWLGRGGLVMAMDSILGYTLRAGASIPWPMSWGTIWALSIRRTLLSQVTIPPTPII